MLPLILSNKIKLKDRQSALIHFGIPGASPIGVGTEAEVYALPNSCVLKLYPDCSKQKYFRELAKCLGSIDETPSGLAIPKIQSTTLQGSILCVIESRIDGVSFETVLPRLSNSELKLAEQVYFQAAAKISSCRLLSQPKQYLFFDPAGDSTTQYQTWPQYYSKALQGKIEKLAPILGKIIPKFKALSGLLVAALACEPVRELSLVSGDFHPGNLMVKPDMSAAVGVIDFGTFSLFGNPALDIAGAFGFYKMYDPKRQEIRDSIEETARSMLPKERAAEFYRYLLSHAIMTCDLYAETNDLLQDGHFIWAVEILSQCKYWERAEIGA